MIKMKSLYLASVLALGTVTAVTAETTADLNLLSVQALQTLCKTDLAAADLAQHASWHSDLSQYRQGGAGVWRYLWRR